MPEILEMSKLEIEIRKERLSKMKDYITLSAEQIEAFNLYPTPKLFALTTDTAVKAIKEGHTLNWISNEYDKKFNEIYPDGDIDTKEEIKFASTFVKDVLGKLFQPNTPDTTVQPGTVTRKPLENITTVNGHNISQQQRQPNGI
jgi:hypothetical protein